MTRRLAALASVLLTSALAPAGAAAAPVFEPGAPGLGDEYFPLDGNGGYDVRHYDLDLEYEPATDELTGLATIKAKATQYLSSFNLDLDDLTVRSVRVNHRRAAWAHADGELTITPARGLRRHRRFTVEVRYEGAPVTLPDSSGFLHTDDGALAVGQPHGAATWYPANDHPSDKASYRFELTVPEDLEAVANGVLRRRHPAGAGKQTWTWVARDPMASYLAMIAIGEFDLRAYETNGIAYWDAVDPRLSEPIVPRTGERFALSQAADTAYKRLARTIAVPAGGGELSFWVRRDTEASWDFFFVEAHRPGTDDWTTLPDANGHTSRSTGSSCPFWLALHPFLGHYQTAAEDGCAPEGTTGAWHAASGSSNTAWEQWTIDLSAYAGQQVELALSYASDDVVALPGVIVDDIAGPGGEGSTSFEDDGDVMDGWAVSGPPAGSGPNANDWLVGGAADAPEPMGVIIDASLARQPDAIAFLSELFGPYPFRVAGGVVDIAPLGFALETQTRPVYATAFFTNAVSGEEVVVHELAHQWAGDDVSIARWRDIWLNEGFATYTEWRWAELEGRLTAQQTFDFYAGIPADDPFWSVTIGHPQSADLLFDIAVYYRGAMTLHALSQTIGEAPFAQLLKLWFDERSGGHATVEDFIATAERVSGQELDAFFATWLFTPAKPPGIEPPAGTGAPEAAALLRAPAHGLPGARFPKR
jgi:hypothetical protein